MRRWNVLNSKYLLKRPWIAVREDHVSLPNGSEIEEFHVVEYQNWASVLCITPEKEIVCVEQYRHGIGRLSLELPGGVIEEGEDIQEAARRELLEETGYGAEKMVFLGKCATDPCNHSNYAHLFVALDGRPVQEQMLDDQEDIVVKLIQPAAVTELVQQGFFVHGIHLTALFWAAQKGFLKDL